MITASLDAIAQSIDTVTISSLTLRIQDWAWGIGRYGDGTDSASRVRIRQLRDAIRAVSNPTYNTNVTLTNVPGRVVLYIYEAYCNAPFSEVFAMGNNTAERTNIFTTIKSVNNSALQYFIGVIDANGNNLFLNTRNHGRSILLDN